MNHLLDRLPEIATQPWSDLYTSELRLDLHEISMQSEIVLYLFAKLLLYFPKTADFTSEKQKGELNLGIWKCGLCDLNFAAIATGLYHILAGKTCYTDFPPNSVVAFHKICTTVHPKSYGKKFIMKKVENSTPKLTYKADPERSMSMLKDMLRNINAKNNQVYGNGIKSDTNI